MYNCDVEKLFKFYAGEVVCNINLGIANIYRKIRSIAPEENKTQRSPSTFACNWNNEETEYAQICCLLAFHSERSNKQLALF